MQAHEIKGMRFEGEADDERTLFFVRAHPFTNVPWLILVAAGLFVPLFVEPFFDFVKLEVSIERGIILSSLLTWILLLFAYSFQRLLHWYFNLYLLTDKRVVDIDFTGLFYRKISQASLRNIEDVSFSKGGIAQNFLDYGDIHIQTAGTEPNFEFHAIPDPEGVQKTILELVTRAKLGNI